MAVVTFLVKRRKIIKFGKVVCGKYDSSSLMKCFLLIIPMLALILRNLWLQYSICSQNEFFRNFCGILALWDCVLLSSYLYFLIHTILLVMFCFSNEAISSLVLKTWLQILFLVKTVFVGSPLFFLEFCIILLKMQVLFLIFSISDSLLR